MKFSSKTMNLNFKDGVGYLTFKEFKKYEFIKHAFSTRIGGVSENEYKSLNLSFLKTRSRKETLENYKIISDAVGFDYESLILTSQVHGNKIRMVTYENRGAGILKPQDMEGADGLVTNVSGVTLVTLHADCPSIFMFDPVKKAVGLAHAGWRGTVKKIGPELIQAFIQNYDSSTKDLICGIGPSITKCCFEVSKTILPEFEKLNLTENYIYASSSKSFDKVNLDLMEINKQLLIMSGVLYENIHISDVCTMCNNDLLFSHRFTNGKRGNNAAMISF